jgi:hypothetical protein
MKKTVKKYFIPQKENNHKPYFLRAKTLGVVALFVFIIEIALFSNVYFFSSRIDYLASVLPGVLVSLTNENRAENNLSDLSTNTILQRAAQMKADDMASRGYFAHTSPEGYEPWHWLDKAGYQYLYAGENLAVNFVDSEDVTVAWMNSPAHKANIVNKNYTEVGIAVASGFYKGRQTVFVAQFFGTPKKIVSAPPAPTESNTINPISNLSQNTTEPEQSLVLGTETKASVPDSFLKPIEKVITSPRTLSDYFFGGLILLLSVALSLTIFVAIRIQHPNTIAGAVAMIVLIAGLMYFNSFIFRSDGVKMPSDNVASVIQAF